MFKIKLVLTVLLLSTTLCAQDNEEMPTQIDENGQFTQTSPESSIEPMTEAPAEQPVELSIEEPTDESMINEVENTPSVVEENMIESQGVDVQVPENNLETNPEVAPDNFEIRPEINSENGQESSSTKAPKDSEEMISSTQEAQKENKERQTQGAFTKFFNHIPQTVGRFHVHLGNHTQFVGEYQTDDQGETNKVAYNPVIGAGMNIHFWKRFWLAPEFILGLPRHDRDDHTKRTLYFFRLDALIPLPYVHLRLGSSYIVSRFSSNGGTQTLRNGDSTQDFFLPPIATASSNYTWDLGIDYLAYKNFKLRLQTFIYRPVTEQTRTISYTFGIGYQFDQIPFFKI